MADEPSLGEVNRNVTALRHDLQSMRGELVRNDVYSANRLADDIRIKAVETILSDSTDALRADIKAMQENSAAMRRLVLGSLIGAGFAVVAQIFVAVFVAVMLNR